MLIYATSHPPTHIYTDLHSPTPILCISHSRTLTHTLLNLVIFIYTQPRPSTPSLASLQQTRVLYTFLHLQLLTPLAPVFPILSLNFPALAPCCSVSPCSQPQLPPSLLLSVIILTFPQHLPHFPILGFPTFCSVHLLHSCSLFSYLRVTPFRNFNSSLLCYLPSFPQHRSFSPSSTPPALFLFIFVHAFCFLVPA